MPNDAKLGLVVGVGLVIAIGVVYFRKDATASSGREADGAAPAVSSVAAAPRSQYRPARAQPVMREDSPTGERQHVVVEGETLFSIAERYYGARDRFTLIQRANAARLQSPGELEPGTVLVIPERGESNP